MILYGSIVFVGQESSLSKVEKMILNETFLVDQIIAISEPMDIELDQPALMYNVEFGKNQWLNIFTLQETLKDAQINVDVIHALTDGETMVEVISTNPTYDSYSRDPDKMYELSEMYHLQMISDDDIDDYQEDEDEDETDDDYFNSNN